MAIKFKHAKQSQLPKIVEIYNQVIDSGTVTADLAPVTVSERQDWFDAFDPQKYPIWVIYQGVEMIGWVSLEPFYGRAAYQNTAEISIYVDEKFHRQNVGTQTLDFVANQLHHLDINNLVAFVFKQNTPSMHLFQKQNFVQWGLLPKVAQINGHYLDLSIMGKYFP